MHVCVCVCLCVCVSVCVHVCVCVCVCVGVCVCEREKERERERERRTLSCVCRRYGAIIHEFDPYFQLRAALPRGTRARERGSLLETPLREVESTLSLLGEPCVLGSDE